MAVDLSHNSKQSLPPPDTKCADRWQFFPSRIPGTKVIAGGPVDIRQAVASVVVHQQVATFNHMGCKMVQVVKDRIVGVVAVDQDAMDGISDYCFIAR